MQRNTGYFPTESLEPSGNRLFSRSALNEGYLFRGSLEMLPLTFYESSRPFFTYCIQFEPSIFKEASASSFVIISHNDVMTTAPVPPA